MQLLGNFFASSRPPSWARALGAPANVKAVYDFTNQRYWRARSTFTRASPAWAEDNAGVYSAYGVDVPRISDKGIKLEVQRTNNIRNNSMNGAVVGMPGTLPINWSIAPAGLSTQVIGVGTDNGLDTVDIRLFGTTTAATATIAFDTAIGISATTGQQFAQSCFMCQAAGSMANITQINLLCAERTSAGVAVKQNNGPALVISPILTRFAYLFTTSGGEKVGTVQPIVRLVFPVGVTIDVTLRLAPQLEQAASVSSPIRTETKSDTRLDDALTLKLAEIMQTLTLKFVDDTTQTIEGVSGDTLIDPTQLNRPDLKSAWAVPI